MQNKELKTLYGWEMNQIRNLRSKYDRYEYMMSVWFQPDKVYATFEINEFKISNFIHSFHKWGFKFTMVQM